MISKQIVTPKGRARYVRNRPYNRRGQDLQRILLNILMQQGPTPYTQLMYLLETNAIHIGKHLADLAEAGFIIQKHRKEFFPRKGRRPQTSRINRFSPTVKKLIQITPLGVQYVKKINELERMIKWET